MLSSRKEVRGYTIDADYLMAKVAEEYGERARDALYRIIRYMPPAQTDSCEGCKHLGKWENEYEYGYPCPCLRCKRRAEDHYER